MKYFLGETSSDKSDALCRFLREVTDATLLTTSEQAVIDIFLGEQDRLLYRKLILQLEIAQAQHLGELLEK